MAVILHVVMISFWVLHLPPWIGLPLWKWFKSMLEFFNVVQVITNYATHYLLFGTFWNAGVNILGWHMTSHIHLVLKPPPRHKIPEKSMNSTLLYVCSIYLPLSQLLCPIIIPRPRIACTRDTVVVMLVS